MSIDFRKIEKIKSMTLAEAKEFAGEIRKFLIENVTLTGGHLASNLGIVEISLALMRVFSPPRDSIIYDTGHQSYVHKLLSGRHGDFGTLRQYGGMSGFTKRSESVFDPFGAGHSSTSVSAALGVARAASLRGENRKTVAVIGDGAFTGGMVFEALNNIRKNDDLIIILNDNEMSISKNVGAMSKYLGRIRSKTAYLDFKGKSRSALEAIPLVGESVANAASGLKNSVKSFVLRDNMFEQLGINYLGPADGNDLETVEALLREAKRKKNPSIIHLHTKKGKGYIPAEKNPCNYHSLSPVQKAKKLAENSFSEVFGDTLSGLAEKDRNIVFVTAAMAEGVGIAKVGARFPERFFDVGIAEQHAATFTAGLAAGGCLPFFAVYSTFFQRCYDQLLHDIVLQNLKTVFILDRAGFVGQDGPTHHGIFDVSITLNLPGLVIYSPATYKELVRALGELTEKSGDSYRVTSPAIVRYAKGAERRITAERFDCESDAEIYCPEERPDAVIVTYGSVTANALEASDILTERGISTAVVKLAKLKPFPSDDFEALLEPLGRIKIMYFLEEGMKCSGFAEHLLSRIGAGEIKVDAGRFVIRAVEDQFVPQGRPNELFSHVCMEPGQIADEIEKSIYENR